jgi:tetratricopeptide (TPR) repeat protein
MLWAGVGVVFVVAVAIGGVLAMRGRENGSGRERAAIAHHTRSHADQADGAVGDSTPVSAGQAAGNVEAAPIAQDGGDNDGAMTGDAEAAVASDGASPEVSADDAGDTGGVESLGAGTSDAAEAAASTPEQVREARHLANRAALIAGRSHDEALEMARRATELDPEQSTAWFVIAFVESERGNTEAAREAVERCLARPSAVAGDCRALQRSLAE